MRYSTLRSMALEAGIVGFGLAFTATFIASGVAAASHLPKTSHIDSVIMSRPQPHESDAAVIWYDDFDGRAKPYTETAHQEA